MADVSINLKRGKDAYDLPLGYSPEGLPWLVTSLRGIY